MITVYTFKGCPYCSELKEMYDKDGLQYRDVDVELPENEEEFNKIMEIAKAEEVPIIKVGKQLLVPNVSFHSIAEGFELTKKLLG